MLELVHFILSPLRLLDRRDTRVGVIVVKSKISLSLAHSTLCVCVCVCVCVSLPPCHVTRFKKYDKFVTSHISKWNEAEKTMFLDDAVEIALDPSHY